MKTQPVIAGLVARWAVTWLASKGFELNLEQAMILFGTLEAIITPLVWRAVTPNARVAAKVAAEVKRQSVAPATLVGLVMLALVGLGCVDPEGRALCHARVNAKWAAAAEKACPDTVADSDVDWDSCPHRQALVDGNRRDLEACP